MRGIKYRLHEPGDLVGVEEVFVIDKNFCFNSVGFVFRSTGPRSRGGQEVDVNFMHVDCAEKLLELKEQLADFERTFKETICKWAF